MNIELKKIRTDGDTQSRVQLNQDVVSEYAERINEGDEFPPITVFHDGADYWLADGFHRYFAHKRADKQTIEATVETGTIRDALLYSAGANAKHGLRRTNDDKRRAVLRLLNDVEWSELSDREIARKCEVSHPTVARIKNSLQIEEKSPEATPKPRKEVPQEPAREEYEEEDPVKEMSAEIEALAQENTALKEKMAVGFLEVSEEEKLNIEEQLEAYKQKISVLETENEAIRRSRDSMQNEKAELVRQVMYWKKRAEKAEKQTA